MIRAVMFDCFGVLTTDTWHAFLDSLPSSADVEQARALNRAFDAGTISREDYLKGVEEATGASPPDIEKMYGGEVVKNEALLGYIRELKPRYRIGIISNISSNWIREQLLTPEEQELFDAMVFSYEVGMTKPDPRMFTLALERLRATPEEAVLVDDIDRYVRAAREMGMHGVVYQNMEQMKAELRSVLDAEH